MNYTKASCGHPVIAVGSPGSLARADCESKLCPNCYKNVVEDLLHVAIGMTKEPSHVISTISKEAGAVAAEWYKSVKPNETTMLYVIAALLTQGTR